MRGTGREDERPPRLVRFLLSILVPEDDREFFFGDVEEGGRRPWTPEILGAAALRLQFLHRVPRPGTSRRSASMINHLAGDLRLGVRRLIRAPGSTAIVAVALAVGIGLSALMFSTIRTVILPTLPFENGERIVSVGRPDFTPIPIETLEYWMERQTSFEGLGAAAERTVTLAIEGRGSEPISTAAITLETLPLLSVQPILGRSFDGDDAIPGAPTVVLIGHEVWQERFGGDPRVLGEVVRMSGEPAEVIGVMPEGFGFPWDQHMWTPRELAGFQPDGNPERFNVFGMLREGATGEAAAAELVALENELPRAATEPLPTPVSVRAFTDIINPAGRSQLISGLMLGVAFLVLLVACANGTNVLLAQASMRGREVALRTALGASRLRIAGQFWTEVFLLAFLGAVGGALFAWLGIRIARNSIPDMEGTPFWFELRLDLAVLGFVMVAAVTAAILAGVAPSVHASRENRHELLKDASRGASSRRLGRTMGWLIGGEMAVSFVLLIAAGLFIRSAVNLQTYEFSFEPEGVYTAVVSLGGEEYETGEARANFAEQLEERLDALPEAVSAAVSTGFPGVGGVRRVVAVEGSTEPSDPELPFTRFVATSPGYFEVFHASVMRGRGFDSGDRMGELPVAVVSESFERIYLSGDAIGRRVALPTGEGEAAEWRTVVGVVPDMMAGGLDAATQDAVYVPYAQELPTRMMVVLRSRTSADALAAPLRLAVADVDPDAALSFMRSHQDAIRMANAQFALLSGLFLVAGVLALALAAIGLYGVMAFWVAQRTREIGVRMAIGGARSTIVRFVLRQGMIPIAVGLTVGLLFALPIAWLLRAGLLGVSAFDPVTFASVLCVLVGAGWLGCALPALRATRVDPLRALSAE